MVGALPINGGWPLHNVYTHTHRLTLALTCTHIGTRAHIWLTSAPRGKRITAISHAKVIT